MAMYYYDPILGALVLDTVQKFNKWHDKRDGKFTTGPSGQLSVASLTGVQSIATSRLGARWVATHQDPRHTGSNWAGSLNNPIYCGKDIEKAAKLIASGQHVILDQPDQVATLVDKIQQEYKAAKAAGETPPFWNLANISVKGTNLFAVENLGVPRIQMPQLGGRVDAGSKAAALLPKGADLSKDEVDLTGEFIKSLKAKGIASHNVTLPASHLRATQDELDGAKMAAIAAEMDAGTMSKGSVVVTRDNYVLDGHHRWGGTMIRDLRDNHPGDIPLTVHKLDLDIGTALSLGREFQKKWGIADAVITQKLDLGWIFQDRG